MDLNTVIPSGSGWELLNAVGINDGGQIAGTGQFHGRLHAFLLNPRRGTGSAAIAATAEQAEKPMPGPLEAKATRAIHSAFALPSGRPDLDWVHFVMGPCRER